MNTHIFFLSCMIIAIILSLSSIYIYDMFGFLAAVSTIIIAIFWLELGFYFKRTY